MALDDGAGTGGAGGDVGSAAGLLGGAAGAGTTDGGGGTAGGTGAGDGGAAGGGATGAEVGTPDWFEKVSAAAGEGETASNRDWLAAKGVKDIDGLVKITRDTERSLRDGSKIKVPGDGAKPEEVAAFRAAIGVPDKIEGYEFTGPEGVSLDQPKIDALKASALRHGAPVEAFKGMVGDFIKLQLDEAEADRVRQDGLATAWVKEQGAKKDEQLAHIDAAARGLGLTATDMTGLRSGLGADRALSLLAKLGAGMAEDTLITGGKGRFGVTGAEAQVELDRLKADPEFAKKVTVAGSPERLRWDRLNLAAAEARAAQEQG
jgi:hypothetical protein